MQTIYHHNCKLECFYPTLLRPVLSFGVCTFVGLPLYSSVVQLADFPSWLWVLSLKVNIVVGDIVLAVTESHNKCSHEQEAVFITAGKGQISIEALLILLVSVFTPNPPALILHQLVFKLWPERKMVSWFFYALLNEKAMFVKTALSKRQNSRDVQWMSELSCSLDWQALCLLQSFRPEWKCWLSLVFCEQLQ